MSVRKIRFIGDVHGKYDRYKAIIAECEESIQVGDMGVGFRRTHGPREGEVYGNPPHYAMIKGKHRFIRGNHDNPAVCKNHSQWIPDGFVDDDMMFVGGADSIDRQFRIENYSWWPDEQLSIELLTVIASTYFVVQPPIMVTHDCPQEIGEMILLPLLLHPRKDAFEATRTRQAFQVMWEGHKPKLWIFGHYHVAFDKEVNGTRFICLPELGYIDLEV